MTVQRPILCLVLLELKDSQKMETSQRSPVQSSFLISIIGTVVTSHITNECSVFSACCRVCDLSLSLSTVVLNIIVWMFLMSAVGLGVYINFPFLSIVLTARITLMVDKILQDA